MEVAAASFISSVFGDRSGVAVRTLYQNLPQLDQKQNALDQNKR
jgi:hypothetical protein